MDTLMDRSFTESSMILWSRVEIQQEQEQAEKVFGEKTLIMKYVRNFCLFAVLMYGKFRSRYEWSQFFIVQAKADTAKKGLEEGNVELTKKQQALFLDQGGYPSLTGSYTVFGQMINGYDVLDKISGCKTQDNGSGEVSQPVKKVVIEKMTVSNAE